MGGRLSNRLSMLAGTLEFNVLSYGDPTVLQARSLRVDLCQGPSSADSPWTAPLTTRHQAGGLLLSD